MPLDQQHKCLHKLFYELGRLAEVLAWLGSGLGLGVRVGVGVMVMVGVRVRVRARVRVGG